MRPLWYALLALALFFEGYALGRPVRGDTISESIWLVRDHALGRFLVLPLWCWLTYHLVLKGRGPALGYQDVVAIAIGLAWAYAEARR